MQVLAVAKAQDIHTFGCQALLQPFVDQMKLLAQVFILHVRVSFIDNFITANRTLAVVLFLIMEMS